MALLGIQLLGSFRVELSGDPVTGFKSDKARALLAFLAVEAEQPHSRDYLSWLLWPDSSNQAALTNLRSILANLRKVIHDPLSCTPHLLVSRQEIQFNQAGDHWLDVSVLASCPTETKIANWQVGGLEEVVRLYRGPFLSGFSIPDSDPFENWLVLKREEMIRQVMVILTHLVTYYEQHGEYGFAQTHAWKMVEIEPVSERAHRHLIRVLALSGQRCAALRRYNVCRNVLNRELGVEPSHETTMLYEAIRDDRLETLLNHYPLGH